MITPTTDEVEDVEKKCQEIKLEEFPPELLIKHPLQNTWTLWYFELDKNKSWEDSQHVISSFDTVEDFWSLFNHIKSAADLKQGCDYSLFKHGIRPMWEDSANKNGGRWLLNLDKKQRFSDLNDTWLDILLCLIGEAFDEYSEDVCGAVVNVRPKGDKIALWTADVNNIESKQGIERILKRRLRVTYKVNPMYQPHRSQMVKDWGVKQKMNAE